MPIAITSAIGGTGAFVPLTQASPIITFLVTTGGGAPVVGQAVTFTATGGVPNPMAPITPGVTMTDATGSVSFRFFPFQILGFNFDSYTITATAGTYGSISFFETLANFPPATIALLNPGNTLYPYNGSAPLQIQVQCASNVPNVAVWIATLISGVWTVASGVTLTNSSGIASISPGFTGMGTFRIYVGALNYMGPFTYSTSSSTSQPAPNPGGTGPAGTTGPYATPTSPIPLPGSRGNLSYTQVRAADRLGNGVKFQMAAGPFVSGNTPIYADDGSLVDSGTASAVATAAAGAAGASPIVINTHANRATYSAGGYSLYIETDTKLVYASIGGAWTYAAGVYALAQSAIAAFAATLTAADVGTLIYVTDYLHTLQWSGSAWGWAPGDEGSAHVRTFYAAPAAGRGWVALGGSITYLLSSGSTASVSTSAIAAGNYLQAGSSPGPTTPVTAGAGGAVTLQGYGFLVYFRI